MGNEIKYRRREEKNFVPGGDKIMLK